MIYNFGATNIKTKLYMLIIDAIILEKDKTPKTIDIISIKPSP